MEVYKIVLVILCYILFISACIYIFIYLFIYLGFSFTIVLYVCYLLWNYFMCILLYMIMCMLLSATSTHFKWELMLYCLHCPTLNKVFLLLLLLLHEPCYQGRSWCPRKAVKLNHSVPNRHTHDQIKPQPQPLWVLQVLLFCLSCISFRSILLDWFVVSKNSIPLMWCSKNWMCYRCMS